MLSSDLCTSSFFWDTDCRGALSYQDLVLGLSDVMFNDLMSNIEWFFKLHDGDHDGSLTKDEVLQLSESLLVRSSSPVKSSMESKLHCSQFIFRSEVGDAYLGAVSRFMTNAFEYGDALLPAEDVQNGDAETFSPKKPYMNLAT